MKQTSTTLETTIQAIGETLKELTDKAKLGKLNKTDYSNMAILTDCVKHLQFFNKEMFNCG